MFAIKSFTDRLAGRIYCVAECVPGGKWIALSYHKERDAAEIVLGAYLRLQGAGESFERTMAALTEEVL